MNEVTDHTQDSYHYGADFSVFLGMAVGALVYLALAQFQIGDKAAAQTALQMAQPELHRATTKGVMHRNTVARKLSRLAAQINAL